MAALSHRRRRAILRSMTAALLYAGSLSAALATGAPDELATSPASHPSTDTALVDPMDPQNWEIGPLTHGQIRSFNMPLHPTRHPEGWAIDFPHPTQDAGSVHYVTMPTGPLLGKSRIVLEYRVEAEEARLVARRFPDKPGTMTLYFQRAGDNWTREMEAYRWYATSTTHEPLPGTKAVEARLDQGWISMMWTPSESNPAGFEAALAEAWRVGFVLGGGDGLGHGAYATGPFRLVVTSFRIE